MSPLESRESRIVEIGAELREPDPPRLLPPALLVLEGLLDGAPREEGDDSRDPTRFLFVEEDVDDESFLELGEDVLVDLRVVDGTLTDVALPSEDFSSRELVVCFAEVAKMLVPDALCVGERWDRRPTVIAGEDAGDNVGVDVVGGAATSASVVVDGVRATFDSVSVGADDAELVSSLALFELSSLFTSSRDSGLNSEAGDVSSRVKDVSSLLVGAFEVAEASCFVSPLAGDSVRVGICGASDSSALVEWPPCLDSEGDSSAPLSSDIAPSLPSSVVTVARAVELASASASFAAD